MNLNLVNPDVSGINFTHTKFPDGQQQITLENYESLVNYTSPVVIYSRMNNFMDLEKIICANQALIEAGFREVHLKVPFFLGSRSDRKFAEGSSNYLKNVICPIINSQNFKKVSVLDPHSDVLEACLKNFHKEDNLKFVRESLVKIDNTNEARERIVLVSPDGGALKKIHDVAHKFTIPKIITAVKHRDVKTGKITRTEVPTLDQHLDLKYVIVDDICDGGRTFIELAKAMKASRPTAKIYLVVTHGIFSQGITPLAEHFEKIFTTNSYRDFQDDPEDTDLEQESKKKLSIYNLFPL